MIRISRILCPVDSSTCSSRALSYAAVLASWYQAELTALSVVPAPAHSAMDYEFQGDLPLAAREAIARDEDGLRTFVANATGSGATRILTTVGPVVGQIVDVAATLPADLVVLGTHGHGGFDRLLLGSVTEKVLRRAPCPVVTVPPLAQADASQVLKTKTIVCGIDFSVASLRGLDYALSLAQEAGGRLVLVHALEGFAEVPQRLTDHFNVPEFRQALEHDARARLEALVPRAARTWCDAEVVVGHGKAYVEVLRVAAEHDAGLIVLGVHGRGAVDLLLFGSTTQQVVRQATCPVLTVR